MPPEGGTLADYAFAMLDLLTREASQSSFEDLVRQARRAGATAEELEQLARAKEHSLGIRQLFAHRRQREAGLSALVDTARDLTQPYTLDALLKVITRRARLLLGLDMSWVSFHDPDTGSSLVRAADGHASAITVGFRVPLGGGIGHLARSRSAPFWTPDYLADDGFPHSGKIDEVVRSEGLRAIMALPLQHEDDTFGVLYVADRNVRHFTPADLALMASLADLAAVAIERTHLLTQAQAKAGETDLDGAWPADAPPALESSPGARRRRSSRRELIDMVLDGADLPALVEQGAASLGGALLVRDPAGKELAVSGAFPAYDTAAVEAAALDAHVADGPVQTSDGLWLYPVSAGGENLATLVLHQPDPLCDAQDSLQVAAQAVGVLLLIQRRTAVAERQFRDEHFKELLNASHMPPHLLAERARRLAVDTDEPHVVVAARPDDGHHKRALIWATSYTHRLGGLKCVDGDFVVLLLPGSDPSATARTVAKELSAVLGHQVTVGCAGPVPDLTAVQQTYQDAQRCVDALTALGGAGGAACPEDLGFLGLLLSGSRDIDGFIRCALGPVLDYDSQQSTELLRTLEAYFTSGGSPRRAAEALHVHPNTVSRRLDRVSELLGERWQDPARALDVQLALRLQRTRHVLGGDRHTARPHPANPLLG